MATYAVIHGAGDVGASWDLVAERLRARGHRVVAPDLPCDDEAGCPAEGSERPQLTTTARRPHSPPIA